MFNNDMNRFDINRLPNKEVIDSQKYLLRGSFMYLATNRDGVVDPGLRKVIDAVFKDIFDVKKVFSRLLKSEFAFDTFSPYQEVNFVTLSGFLDAGNNLDIVRDLVMINKSLRLLDEKIQKNKRNARKASKVKKWIKQQEELAKLYRKNIKKMQKEYMIKTSKSYNFDFAREFAKKKSYDDMYDWFQDGANPDYRWGDKPSRNGRFGKMMSQMNRDQESFHRNFGDAGYMPTEPAFQVYPLQDLSKASVKMNGYAPDYDDEEDDYDEYEDMLGDLDFAKYSPVENPDMVYDSQALQDILAENPNLAQASMDNLSGKKHSTVPEDFEDFVEEIEEDDEDDRSEFMQNDQMLMFMENMLKSLTGISERLNDLEEQYSEIPTFEGIKQALVQSQSNVVKYVDEQLAKVGKDVPAEAPSTSVVEEVPPVQEEVKPVEETTIPPESKELEPLVVEVQKAEEETSVTVEDTGKQIIEEVLETPSSSRVLINNNQRIDLGSTPPKPANNMTKKNRHLQ